jgi:bacterial/archaeal transporter family-2 protein
MSWVRAQSFVTTSFVGFTVSAALITSLVIDHFGWFRMQPHPLNVGRMIGGALLVSGITLIAKF